MVPEVSMTTSAYSKVRHCEAESNPPEITPVKTARGGRIICLSIEGGGGKC